MSGEKVSSPWCDCAKTRCCPHPHVVLAVSQVLWALHPQGSSPCAPSRWRCGSFNTLRRSPVVGPPSCRQVRRSDRFCQVWKPDLQRAHCISTLSFEVPERSEWDQLLSTSCHLLLQSPRLHLTSHKIALQLLKFKPPSLRRGPREHPFFRTVQNQSR